MAADLRTIPDMIRRHARCGPDERAFVFLPESAEAVSSISYGELDRQARLLAGNLLRVAEPGDRALLVFPQGLEFVVAFFACLYAGVIAVPTLMPRRDRLRESSVSIYRDCNPKHVLTAGKYLPTIASLFAEIPGLGPVSCLASDANELDGKPAEHLPELDRSSVALLQYTSGSTAAPKGVMVTHDNLSANLRMMTEAYRLDSGSARVGWIPHYHDMGLIFNIVQSSWVGALCVLMAPTSFVQHPWNWLRAISKYRAEFAIAPNSAYDLCVENYRPERMGNVDLSCWKLAVNAAEPVRAETIERFSEVFSAHGFQRTAFHPGYGMAEATLVITGGRFSDQPKLTRASSAALRVHELQASRAGEPEQMLVGCGKGLHGETIAIVDPDTRRRLPGEKIGEIWVQGPHVAAGYWHNEEETRRTFRAQIVGEESGPWLRTGDLGCLNDAGEIFIVGRIKDVIIIRGQNYAPQDIELTAERSHAALRPSHGTAFAVTRNGRELLVIVFEVKRTSLRSVDQASVLGSIRQAVAQEYGLSVHEVVLVRTGTIAKTSSGKIRRRYIKQQWEDGILDRLDAALEAGDGDRSSA